MNPCIRLIFTWIVKENVIKQLLFLLSISFGDLFPQIKLQLIQ